MIAAVSRLAAEALLAVTTAFGLTIFTRYMRGFASPTPAPLVLLVPGLVLPVMFARCRAPAAARR